MRGFTMARDKQHLSAFRCKRCGNCCRWPGDVVLVCGKGHEQSMNFDGVEYPWDDRHATRTALQVFLGGRPMPNLGLPTYYSL